MIAAAAPLESALAAVPDEIKTVRGLGAARIIAEAERCADLISQAGIMMWWDEKHLAQQRRCAGKSLYRGVGVEPHPDEVTGAVARGLAILAIRPLGVEFAGLHLCDHPDNFGCEPGALAIDPAPQPGDIKARGAHWTPRELAEEVTDNTLEAVVYDPGPLVTADQSKWKLLTPKQILSKSVADISVGAGSFPIAATRYLTARILEQVPAEAGAERKWEHAVREAVITSCLYGADIDLASLELCCVALALMVPLVDVDVEIHRRFRHGDALLGIADIDQLRFWDLDAQRGRAVHGRPVIDVNAVAATGGLDMLWLLADLLCGAALTTAGKSAAARRGMAAEIEPLAARVAASDPGAIETARLRARELLDTDLPAGRPPRKPLHWPLAFPEVFIAERSDSTTPARVAGLPWDAGVDSATDGVAKPEQAVPVAVMLPGLEDAA